MCPEALPRVFMLFGGIVGSSPKVRKRKGGAELVCVHAVVERAALPPVQGSLPFSRHS